MKWFIYYYECFNNRKKKKSFLCSYRFGVRRRLMKVFKMYVDMNE